LAIFPFKCSKCGNVKDFFGSYKDSVDYENMSGCECGGKHERVVTAAVAVWKTDTGTVSHGKQNLAETDKKGGGK
jgi:hypothetical protein